MRMDSSLCAALPRSAALMRFATAMKPGKHFLGVYSFSAIRSIAAAPPSVKPGEGARNRLETGLFADNRMCDPADA